MRIATTQTRVIGALALVLATAALLAPAATGKPIPRGDGQPNLQGSQLDRLLPQASSYADAFERALIATERESAIAASAIYPDAFEREVAERQSDVIGSVPHQDVIDRAVAQRQAEVAREGREPGTARTAPNSDDGGSFDWGLLVTLCAVAAGCLALGAVAFASVRDRRRISTP